MLLKVQISFSLQDGLVYHLDYLVSREIMQQVG